MMLNSKRYPITSKAYAKPLMLWRVTVVAIALACMTACTSIPRQVPVQVVNGIFTERATGRTLYTNDRDNAPFAKLFCVGECVQGWMPLGAGSDTRPTGLFSLIERENGALQWAYRERPLYARDGELPRQQTGHGMANMWRIARP